MYTSVVSPQCELGSVSSNQYLTEMLVALVLLGSIVDLLMFPKSAAAGFSWKYFGHIFSHFLSFLKKKQ